MKFITESMKTRSPFPARAEKKIGFGFRAFRRIEPPACGHHIGNNPPKYYTMNMNHFIILPLSSWGRARAFFLLFPALLAANLGAAPAGAVDWGKISVKVAATRPVRAEHRMVTGQDGFSHIEIVLTNPGESVLTIESVDVSIPLAGKLAQDAEVIHGSSCMGRRALLREPIVSLRDRTKSRNQELKSVPHFDPREVLDPGSRSYSYMYELVRLAEGQYLLAGSLSWRIFIPVLSVSDSAFRVHSDGEGRQLKPGESIAYEKIVLKRSSDWRDLLREFGRAIAVENGIKQVKEVEFKGWATWDYYGRIFTADDILKNMAEVNKLHPGPLLIQIDGGWWTERGDYMSVRANLPGGIKALADKIKAAGNIPGLHFDGFRGDINSEIYRQHPEYFLRDQDGKVIEDRQERYDRVLSTIYFDYSHPGARSYIAECITRMREWGITYFKVDFMRYGLESEIKQAHPHVTKVIAYDPALTSVERFRLGLQAMRDAIGPENYFLGCSAVFGPCIGFVDGMRTGGDIHPHYPEFPIRVLANSGNFYLDGTVFNIDVDYLVFREAADEDAKVSKDPKKSGGSLALHEARMWADYNKLVGNARLQSDNLLLLRPERKALVKEVFDWPAMDEAVPLDLWKRAATKEDGFELILARKGGQIFLGVFNWGAAEKSYSLRAFGLRQPLSLPGRHSTILTYQGTESFAQLFGTLSSR
ncbi:MAG: alpha-galactosidase [Lacunisphaera sp.]|nr:alpha-galactosidase [Lacunisphaera sp.]